MPQRPYCLRSYSDLLSFLSNPESDEFTGPLELKEIERTAIKGKAKLFATRNPYLKISIMTLKSEAWKQDYSSTTVEETLNFYEEDEEICDAVRVCVAFLGLNPAYDKANAKDEWNVHRKGRKNEERSGPDIAAIPV